MVYFGWVCGLFKENRRVNAKYTRNGLRTPVDYPPGLSVDVEDLDLAHLLVYVWCASLSHIQVTLEKKAGPHTAGTMKFITALNLF